MARRQPPYQELAGPRPRRAGGFHHGGGLRQLSGHAGALISWNYDQGADAVPFAAAPRRGGAGWDCRGSRQVRHPEDQSGGFPRRPDGGVRCHTPASRRSGGCPGRRRDFGTGGVTLRQGMGRNWWGGPPGSARVLLDPLFARRFNSLAPVIGQPGAGRGRGARPPHHLCGRAPLVRRYCVPAGLAAGLAAGGFGAQKPGSAAMNSLGGLLIFELIANSVNSLEMMVSACSLLYFAMLSAPKASAMLIAPAGGSMALSESMALRTR